MLNSIGVFLFIFGYLSLLNHETTFTKVVDPYCIAFFFASCKKAKPGIWKNGQINPDKREQFHKYNDEIFKSLKANDVYHLGLMLSKELIDDNYTKVLAEHVSNELKQTDYTVYDEYYIINKNKHGDTVTNTARGINSYSLHYDGTTRETYIALFIPKSGNNDQMITAVYCKFNYGWKLADLELGQYITNDQTAPQLYRLAKEKMDKGYLADALSTMEMAGACLGPNNIMTYQDDGLLLNFYKNITELANKTFKYPLIITQIPTHPAIFRLSNNKTPEGCYPMIYYVSTINLNDTMAIKKENIQIKKVIGKIMPGIDKDKKYLFYSVFSQLPQWKKPFEPLKAVDHYDITEKIN